MNPCLYIVRLCILALILAPLTTESATAKELELSNDMDISGWVVGVGYVAAPNPFIGDSTSSSQLYPIIGYFGERLTWLGTSLNYRLIGQDWYSVNAFVELDSADFDPDTDDSMLAGIDERKGAIEAGFDVNIGYLSLYVRHDASDTHDGGSLGLAIGQHWQLTDRMHLEASVYGERQDKNKTQYYYGVTPAEATLNRPEYVPRRSTTYGVNAQVSLRVSSRSKLIIGAHYSVFGNAIKNSPIVKDDGQYATTVDFVYQLFD